MLRNKKFSSRHRINIDEFVVMASALGAILVVTFFHETWLNDNCNTYCFEIHGYHKLIASNRETKGGEV